MSMGRYLLVGSLWALSFCWPVLASDAQSVSGLNAQQQILSNRSSTELHALVQQALMHNPEIKAAEQSYLSAQAKIRASRALPDPVLSGGIRHVGLNKFTLGQEPMTGLGVMMQQNYPNPLKLDLKELLAYRQSLQLEQAWHLQECKLKMQVQSQYFMLLENRQELEINQEIQDLIKLVQKAVETYYKVGKVHQKDIWQVKTQRSRLEQQELELQRKQSLILNDLHQLLGWPQAQPELQEQVFPEIKIPQKFDVQTSFQAHPLWRQEYETLLIKELDIELAKAQLNPDYMLSGGLTNRWNLEPLWELRAGMTLPIYADEKQKPLINAASEAHQSQRYKLLQTEHLFQQQVQEAWIQIQENSKQHQLFTQQLIPEARLSFDATLAAYMVGSSSLLQVSQNLTDLLRYRQEDLALQLKQYQAIIQLEYFTGEQLL